MLREEEDERPEAGGAGQRPATSSLFPRLESRSSSSAATRPEGEVFLQVCQRLEGAGRAKKAVAAAPSGGEIPLQVQATTVGSWLPREVLLRSPWLGRGLRCLEGGPGISRCLAGEDLEPEEEADEAVSCRATERGLELGLPCRGAGRRLLTPKGLLDALELAGLPDDEVFPELETAKAERLLALALWATVLELPALAGASQKRFRALELDTESLALAMATGCAARDEALLHLSYWRLRAAVTGPAVSEWLEPGGPAQLLHGALHLRGAGRIPLSVLRGVAERDREAKRRRWQVASQGYVLCQLHRKRGEGGSYPHRYELRLDHSDELIMSAVREDEQAVCRLFAAADGAAGDGAALAGGGGSSSSSRCEHSEAFLGSVVPSFWGTTFELYDSGVPDLAALEKRHPSAVGLPLFQRSLLCRVGYETNILGDCPRKVTVDFERDGERHHMENVAPRWDKKLNSYALPFFGRVKKASAKNFQLVVDDDNTTIFLMFGKISKDVFCLDFRAPLTLLDAMAIAVAALAKKRAVS